MARIRTVVLVAALVVLAASCGGGRSHGEVIGRLTREYQKLTEYLRLVESQDEARRILPHVRTAVSKVVDLTEELESLDAPSAEEEEGVAEMRTQLDSARKACRNEVRRAFRIEGVPEVLACVKDLPGGTE